MFVFNVKFSKANLLKGLLVILGMICISLAIVGIVKMSKKITKETTTVEDLIPSNEVATLSEDNYTDVLKMVHEDLGTYIGQKISFVGYVYRVPNLKENEFILARDMYIDSNHLQSVIVGFLCSSSESKNFKNGTWVKITGVIEKGDYFGEIPLISITSIEATSEPKNKFVEQPDDTYVPTAVIY